MQSGNSEIIEGLKYLFVLYSNEANFGEKMQKEITYGDADLRTPLVEWRCGARGP